MIAEATEALIATARDGTAADADFKAAAQSFCDAAGRASAEDVGDALRGLARLFDLPDAGRATFLALLCGTFVERGIDPSAIAAPLTERLRSLLESSAALADACLARMPEPDDEERDRAEVFGEVRGRVAIEMPEQDAAWKALEQIWPPAIAVFSASPKARSAAALPLRDLAARVADHHEAGYWLRLMLGVLDREPILAIEPATMRGLRGRISGVVDNFQLNVLLMDAFPRRGLLARRRVPRKVVDIARGLGPQQTDDIVAGAWNMYTWQGIRPGGNLPDPDDHGSSAAWVWNEGSLEDIPVFEGRRVILLGPPSYVRTWRSQRMFAGLPAGLEVEGRLTEGEARDWLDRMAAAKGAV